RSWLDGGFLDDPLIGAVGIALALLAVWALGLLGALIAFAVAATLLVIAYRMTVGERLDLEREAAVATAAALLKDLRFRGYGETALRRLVRTQGGPRWAGLF